MFRKFSGQALPLGLVLILAGALLTYAMYDSRQLVTEKSQLANAADAAAYSGLLWQARALNFQAYTNRAMVANQVSIAQFVSLKSWTDYGHTTAENINNTIGLFPPARPFTQGAERVMGITDNIVGSLAMGAVEVVDGIIDVVAFLQDSMYYAAFYGTPDIAASIVKKDDESFSVDSKFAIASLALNVQSWNSFIHKRDEGAQKQASLLRKKEVIEESIDGFVRKRNWHFGYLFFGPKQFKLNKEGATKLEYRNKKWVWQGKDTLSLHEKYFTCWRWRCGWKDREHPIGWGKAVAGDKNNRNFLWKNTKAEDRADRYVDDAAIAEGYGGLRAFYELKNLSEENKDPRLYLRVEVSKPENDLNVTTNMKGLGAEGSERTDNASALWDYEKLALQNRTAGNSMSSVATAEIYYQNPSRSTSAHSIELEYANLFNPYWQVRLSDTNEMVTLAAWVAQDTQIANVNEQSLNDAVRYQFNRSKNEVDRLKNWEKYQTVVEKYLQEELDRILALEEQKLGLEGEVKSAEKYLEHAGDAGVSETAIAEKQSELDALLADIAQVVTTVAEVKQQYDEILEVKDDLEKLRDKLLADGLSDVGVDQAEVQVYVSQVKQAKELYDDIRNLDEALLDALKDEGRRFLEEQLDEIKNKVKDEIKEAAQNVLKSALKGSMGSFLGSASGYLDQARMYADEARSAFEDGKAAIDDTINKIDEGMAEVQKQIEDNIGAARQEINNLTDTMNDAISSERSRINGVISSVNREVEILRENKGLYSELEFDRLMSQKNQQLNQLRNDLISKPEQIRADYMAQIDVIEGDITQMRDSIDQVKQEMIDSANEQVDRIGSEFDEITGGIGL